MTRIDWIYQREKDLPEWQVGFVDRRGHWHTESIHLSQDEAADRASYLNSSAKRGNTMRAELIGVIRQYCLLVERWHREGTTTTTHQDFLALQRRAHAALVLAGEDMSDESARPS